MSTEDLTPNDRESEFSAKGDDTPGGRHPRRPHHPPHPGPAPVAITVYFIHNGPEYVPPDVTVTCDKPQHFEIAFKVHNASQNDVIFDATLSYCDPASSQNWLALVTDTGGDGNGTNVLNNKKVGASPNGAGSQGIEHPATDTSLTLYVGWSPTVTISDSAAILIQLFDTAVGTPLNTNGDDKHNAEYWFSQKLPVGMIKKAHKKD